MATPFLYFPPGDHPNKMFEGAVIGSFRILGKTACRKFSVLLMIGHTVAAYALPAAGS